MVSLKLVSINIVPDVEYVLGAGVGDGVGVRVGVGVGVLVGVGVGVRVGVGVAFGLRRKLRFVTFAPLTVYPNERVGEAVPSELMTR
jgi:hypothetical protein